ncbi:uncharacterized protein EDB91DRAFT_1251146 [Suillus paluster]|uniref:uncharacterized protein n=1 Tax=Suillus paluster TaxID=48578 RepID=UPI001B87F425|nr:uncharacterized protein EDB91DRAFT_1251146 [Suillus paluster]KAG1734100.1 hypothetical protein EDB91DRAFT_1251146 [Suillus paluster]
MHVKSDVPNRPPGIPSFRVHIAQSDEERMRQSAETMEPAEGTYLGSVGIFLEETASETIKKPLGNDSLSFNFQDPLARRAEELLARIQYPGDLKGEDQQIPWDDPDRFCIQDQGDDKYLVVDYLRLGKLEHFVVKRTQLENPSFCIDKAYWVFKGVGLGHNKRRTGTRERKRTLRKPPMGDPISDKVVRWLDMFRQPTDDEWRNLPSQWFSCTQLKGGDYEVIDAALSF